MPDAPLPPATPELPSVPPAASVAVPPTDSTRPMEGPVAGSAPSREMTPPGLPTGLPTSETGVDDELLAQVEGEYITRRMIVRQIGLRQADDDAASYEKRVHQRVLSRVVNRIQVTAARRFGLDIRLEVLEKVFQQARDDEVRGAKERAERASPGSGARITFALLLAERGQTEEEFRRLLANEFLVQNYHGILLHGTSGKRPQYDPEPSPGDARRLFEKHPGAFDEKLGVRIGFFILNPLDLLDEGRRDFDQALSEAKSRMTSLLARFVKGEPAAFLAKTYGLDPRAWQVTEPGAYLEKSDATPRPFDAWAFDPARRVGDTTLLDGKGGVVLGVAVLERRQARLRTFDDVRPDILKLIKNVRIQRFQTQHLLDLLRTASVEPRSLLDEVETATRERLRRMDEDPIYKDVRMR